MLSAEPSQRPDANTSITCCPHNFQNESTARIIPLPWALNVAYEYTHYTRLKRTEDRTECGSSVSSKTCNGIPAALIDRHSTGRTLRRWRSAILGGEEKTEGLSQSPPPEPTTGEPQIPSVGPLLDLGAITITETWKGLPQEIVNHVVFMLRDDLKSLKACSLTCKAMFVSTRCVIHRNIRLSWKRNLDLFTIPERQRYTLGEHPGVPVRVLSEISAYGLLSYARHLYTPLHRNFTPADLQPFNDFQRFDRIQELDIYWLHTPNSLETFDTYFTNIVPTLRSLHLNTPMGDTRDILDFIRRFPHLNDFTLKMPPGNPYGWRTWESAPSPIIKKMPPFRGRLKLTNIDKQRGHLPQQLTSLLGSVISDSLISKAALPRQNSPSSTHALVPW